jgi:hypothetical protein
VNEVLRMYGTDCGSNILPTRSGGVVAFQRDRASANTVAIEVLANWYRDCYDLHCLSHTITHCGDNCEEATVELKLFRQDLCALLNFGGGSNKASNYWIKIFDNAFHNPGNIRWWAVFELFIELDTRFDDLVTWVMTAKEDGDVDGVRIDRLHECIINLQRRHILKLELEIIGIVCKPLIKGTYILEGDSCTALIAFDLLESIRHWLSEHTHDMSFPGVQEAIDICSSDDEARPETLDIETHKSNLKAHCYCIVFKCQDYFENTIMVKLEKDVQIYKTCRYLNPVAVRTSNIMVDTQDFKSNVRRSFGRRISDTLIDQMVEEIPFYLQLIRGRQFPVMDENTNPYNYQMAESELFWHDCYHTLPYLSKLARICMTLSASSAAAERVFSKLKCTFDLSQMHSTLSDYTEASMMLQINTHD